MKRYLIFVLLLAAALLCGACNGASYEDSDRKTESVLVVQGSVFDANLLYPVRNIEIVLTSFSSSDKDQTRPLRTVKEYSHLDGTYQVRLEQLREGQSYRLQAFDPDGQLEDSEPMKILDVRQGGNSYDSETGTYTRIVFFVVKNGKLTVL